MLQVVGHNLVLEHHRSSVQVAGSLSREREDHVICQHNIYNDIPPYPGPAGGIPGGNPPGGAKTNETIIYIYHSTDGQEKLLKDL